MIRRTAAALGVALAVLVGTPTAAFAAHPVSPQQDSSVPELQRPDQAPAVTSCDLSHPAAPGDPFSASARTTLQSQYCYAGYKSPTYNLNDGNGIVGPSDTARSVLYEARNDTSDTIEELGVIFTSFADAIWTKAFDPGWMNVFDNLGRQVQQRLSPLAWKYLALTLIAAAVALVWRGRSGNQVRAWTEAGLAALFVGMAALAIQWPTSVTHGAQTVMRSIGDQVGAQVSTPDGRPLTGTATQVAAQATLYQVHYRGWLKREFGSADSTTAQRYGAPLFRAQTLTVGETQTCMQEPTGARCKQIYSAHTDAYKSTAEQVKNSDPLAYEWLQGKHNRLWPSVYETVSAFITSLLRCSAAILIIISLITMVAVIIAIPVVAIIAVIPGRNELMFGVLNSFAYAAICGAIAAVIGPVSAYATGTILTAKGLPGWFGLVCLIIVSVVLLKILRPWQRIMAMTTFSRADARRIARHPRRIRSRFRRAAASGARLAVTGLTAKAIADTALEHHSAEAAADGSSRGPDFVPMYPVGSNASFRSEAVTAPPLPDAVGLRALTAGGEGGGLDPYVEFDDIRPPETQPSAPDASRDDVIVMSEITQPDGRKLWVPSMDVDSDE